MIEEIKNKHREEKLRAKARKKQAAQLEKEKQKKMKKSSLIDKLIKEKDEMKNKNSIIVNENLTIFDGESKSKHETQAHGMNLKSEDKAKKMLEKMGWRGQGIHAYSLNV